MFFWWILYSFLYRASYNLQIVKIWLLSCCFECLLFLFVVWLLRLGLPVLCWTTCSWSYGESSQFLPIEDDINCGSFVYGLYDVEVCSFHPYFLEGFCQERCYILSIAFSASIERIMWFLSFLLLMWCIMLIDVWILNHNWCVDIESLQPRNKSLLPHWSSARQWALKL